jgi:hypothetical protein
MSVLEMRLPGHDHAALEQHGQDRGALDHLVVQERGQLAAGQPVGRGLRDGAA